MKAKELIKITGLPVLFASLCCLSPIIVVLLGLGSVSFASSLGDTLYGDYKWVFRGIGLTLLTISLIIYFRSKGICHISQAKKRRNEIINTVLIVLIIAITTYIIWLYVILHYWGVWLKLWS
jgi:hypothetical protein